MRCLSTSQDQVRARRRERVLQRVRVQVDSLHLHLREAAPRREGQETRRGQEDLRQYLYQGERDSAWSITSAASHRTVPSAGKTSRPHPAQPCRTRGTLSDQALPLDTHSQSRYRQGGVHDRCEETKRSLVIRIFPSNHAVPDCHHPFPIAQFDRLLEACVAARFDITKMDDLDRVSPST